MGTGDQTAAEPEQDRPRTELVPAAPAGAEIAPAEPPGRVIDVDAVLRRLGKHMEWCQFHGIYSGAENCRDAIDLINRLRDSDSLLYRLTADPNLLDDIRRYVTGLPAQWRETKAGRA